MFRIGLLIVAALFLASCAGVEVSCASQSQAYATAMQPLAQQWADATTLASSTPRVSLPNQIAQLQELRRKSDAVTTPDCLSNAHAHFMASQDATIDGYLAFLGQKSDVTVSNAFERAGSELAAWNNGLALATGQPTTVPPTATPPPPRPTITPTSVVATPKIIGASLTVTPDRGPVGVPVVIEGSFWTVGRAVLEITDAAGATVVHRVETIPASGQLRVELTLDRRDDGTAFAPGAYTLLVRNSYDQRVSAAFELTP